MFLYAIIVLENQADDQKRACFLRRMDRQVPRTLGNGQCESMCIDSGLNIFMVRCIRKFENKFRVSNLHDFLLCSDISRIGMIPFSCMTCYWR